MIRYEMVSLSAEIRNVADLPTVEVQDAAGATYPSQHGRLSMVGGAGRPGELPGGKRMESSAVFEVPASASGLRAAVRDQARPEAESVLVALD